MDPVYTLGDDRFFDVVNRSSHANYHIDMTKLYDYYDVDYDADGNRAYVEDSDYLDNQTSEPEPVLGCTDSNALNYMSNANQDDGSCEFLIEDNNNDNQQTSDVDNDCTGICESNSQDSAKSEESDPVFVLSVVMVIIFAVAIAVIFISKGKDEIIESELEDEFVPELPPLEPPKN